MLNTFAEATFVSETKCFSKSSETFFFASSKMLRMRTNGKKIQGHLRKRCFSVCSDLNFVLSAFFAVGALNTKIQLLESQG